eukprot:80993-Chlamydomonas_euryale.AAC.2
MHCGGATAHAAVVQHALPSGTACTAHAHPCTRSCTPRSATPYSMYCRGATMRGPLHTMRCLIAHNVLPSCTPCAVASH